MLRITLGLFLFFVTAEVMAAGCQELDRVDNSPTAVDLTVRPSNPRPGAIVKVTARVTAAGAFSVYCMNPDTSVNYNGGDVDLYLDEAFHSTAKITPNNTNSVLLFTVYDPMFNSYFYYYGFDASHLGFVFRMPFATNSVSVAASFSGDELLSVASDSSAVQVKPFNDVVPTAYIVRAL